MKVKSGSYTTGASATVYPIVLTSVVELKSEAKAKAYMAAYRKYAKKCSSYTEPETGSTVTLTKGKTFRFGDESLTVDTQSVFSSEHELLAPACSRVTASASAASSPSTTPPCRPPASSRSRRSLPRR